MQDCLLPSDAHGHLQSLYSVPADSYCLYTVVSLIASIILSGPHVMSGECAGEMISLLDDDGSPPEASRRMTKDSRIPYPHSSSDVAASLDESSRSRNCDDRNLCRSSRRAQHHQDAALVPISPHL